MSVTILNRNGRKVYIRTAKPEHKLRKPPGWSWNVEIVEKWKKDGIEYITVVSPWEGKTYIASLKTFLEKAIGFDRGYGRQLALPERYWKTVPYVIRPEAFELEVL